MRVRFLYTMEEFYICKKNLFYIWNKINNNLEIFILLGKINKNINKTINISQIFIEFINKNK